MNKFNLFDFYDTLYNLTKLSPYSEAFKKEMSRLLEIILEYQSQDKKGIN